MLSSSARFRLMLSRRSGHACSAAVSRGLCELWRAINLELLVGSKTNRKCIYEDRLWNLSGWWWGDQKNPQCSVVPRSLGRTIQDIDWRGPQQCESCLTSLLSVWACPEMYRKAMIGQRKLYFLTLGLFLLSNSSKSCPRPDRILLLEVLPGWQSSE